jgi:C-terminal processing protease CtpA/Prc
METKIIKSKGARHIPIFSILLAFLFLSIIGYSADANRSIANIQTFSRLYGYVKYFYPSDEAAAMDWDSFAVYGVKKVEKIRNNLELKKILEELFLPIAPALLIYKSGQEVKFSLSTITPPTKTKEDMKVVAWQHLGVGFGSFSSCYKSVRLNRKTILSNSPDDFWTMTNCIDAIPFRGKEIKFKAAVKSVEGGGQLWLRVDREKGQIGFFDNMDNRPIQSSQWGYYEISGPVAADALQICYGFLLKGSGAMNVDDFQLYLKKNNQSESWELVPIKNPSFEADKEGEAPSQWSCQDKETYTVQVTSATAASGSKSVSIKSPPVIISGPLPDFQPLPKIGDHIAKDIGAGLSCLMPIALYGTETYTYPQAPEKTLALLNDNVKREIPQNPGSLSGDDLYVRLADIVIAWNVFQHFYPYFDVVQTNWQAALAEALANAYQDKNQLDFLKNLKKFTAKLKDGHGYVSLKGDNSKSYHLPVSWDWIEKQLVITTIYDETLANIQVGDVVVRINGVTAKDALENEEQYISASTPDRKRFLALFDLLTGEKNTKFHLEIKRNGKTYHEILYATSSIQDFYALSRKNAIQSKMLEKGIYYLNLDRITMEEINQLMRELTNAKAIICDLRGYPNSNHQLINHLLKEKDTAKWMWIPQVIYPDYENVTYQKIGWNMEPIQPHLTAKIVFIINSRAISYAESYLSFIEGYKLATIVGQPSAGTNGDVNPFDLPGGYTIYWTGMRVVKHDGSQHHGVGIIPNVRVERTIKGIKEGRDEFLEKALEIARQ